MKRKVFYLFLAFALDCWAYEYPEGALIGLFSVSETDTICFSKGNLRYNVQEKTWDFANDQLTVLFSELSYPEDRASTKHYVSHQNFFDVFGWATSGWDNTAIDPGAVNYDPLSVWDRQKTETIIYDIDCSVLSLLGFCDTTFAYKYNKYGFGPSSNVEDIDLIGTSANYDFGIYNEINNGGNKKAIWRLPTKDEMHYLLYKRSNAKYLVGEALVNRKKGYILLPDDFVMPQGMIWHFLEQNTTENLINDYTYEQWLLLENAGAVFVPSTYLPYARKEYGSPMFHLGSSIPFAAQYWTSTAYRSTNSDEAYAWTPNGGITSKDREYPCAVRLVCTLSQKQIVNVEKIKTEKNQEPVKIFNNGRLLIERNGIRYNAHGARVK